MRRRLEFRLTMPGVGSWNGKWSGEGRNYTLVESVPAEQAADLLATGSWLYRWDDGWCARVSVRAMEKGERKKKSDGFCGYKWMVENILRWGTPECQHEFRPCTIRENEVRCRWCSMSRLVEATP